MSGCRNKTQLKKLISVYTRSPNANDNHVYIYICWKRWKYNVGQAKNNAHVIPPSFQVCLGAASTKKQLWLTYYTTILCYVTPTDRSISWVKSLKLNNKHKKTSSYIQPSLTFLTTKSHCVHCISHCLPLTHTHDRSPNKTLSGLLSRPVFTPLVGPKEAGNY